jgi:hypothetical protein
VIRTEGEVIHTPTPEVCYHYIHNHIGTILAQLSLVLAELGAVLSLIPPKVIVIGIAGGAIIPETVHAERVVQEQKTVPPMIGLREYSTSTVRELVEASATSYGVPVNLAVRLAEFESGFNYRAKNPKSTAKGVFQFLDGTWRDYCIGDVFDPIANIDCAMQLLRGREIQHWTADPKTRERLIRWGHVICDGKGCRAVF